MSHNNYLIYKFTSPSGKSYIGQTNNFKRRISGHKSSSGCTAFYSAIKKHGFESFALEILHENLTINEANHWEVFYINEHGTLSPNGYNLRTGGESSIPSMETRARMSAAKIGKKTPEETREKMSVVQKGKVKSPETCARISASKTNPSAETRANLSAALKHHFSNPLEREKISIAAKNRPPISEETRQKMRESGKNRPPVSDETRAKISAANKNPSAETRAKISTTMKGVKKSPEMIAKSVETRRLNRVKKQLKIENETFLLRQTGLSVTDIANKMGVSDQTVYNNLKRFQMNSISLSQAKTYNLFNY